MATYLELYGLKNDADLANKCEVAVMEAATEFVRQYVINPANVTDDQIIWARYVINNSRTEGQKVLSILLADNKDLTTVQITGASDATIQSKVDEVVDALVKAMSVS